MIQNKRYKLAILAAFFILVSLVHVTGVTVEKLPVWLSPSTCFPDYACSDWGGCIDGLESRICEDLECGRREIVERKFCTTSDCTPQVECLRWSQCIYTERIDNLLKGEIGFGGYQNRICRDSTGCVDSFVEEKPCEDFFPVELGKVEECNEEFLVAVDPGSDRVIAKISVRDWESEEKLNIIFTQGDTLYCPSCYNGELDPDEESIDCGPNCKECAKQPVFPQTSAIIAAWLLAGLFSLLAIREILYDRENRGSILA
jgi:hypothetical protein